MKKILWLYLSSFGIMFAILSWVQESGFSGDDIITRGLFNDMPILVFVIVFLAIVLGTIWGPKINFGSES